MAWLHVALGLALITVSGLALWAMLNASRRLLMGHPVRGTVLGAYPEGVNRYPPYGSWGPRIEVAYELGGQRRKTTLWLDVTQDSDYEQGQQIDLFVSRRFPRRARTAADANVHGGLLLNLDLFLGTVGIGLLIWGLVGLIRGR